MAMNTASYKVKNKIFTITGISYRLVRFSEAWMRKTSESLISRELLAVLVNVLGQCGKTINVGDAGTWTEDPYSKLEWSLVVNDHGEYLRVRVFKGKRSSLFCIPKKEQVGDAGWEEYAKLLLDFAIRRISGSSGKPHHSVPTIASLEDLSPPRFQSLPAISPPENNERASSRIFSDKRWIDVNLSVLFVSSCRVECWDDLVACLKREMHISFGKVLWIYPIDCWSTWIAFEDEEDRDIWLTIGEIGGHRCG